MAVTMHPRRHLATRRAAGLLLTLLLTSVTACAGDDNDDSASTTTEATTSPTTNQSTDAETATITAVDYGFEGVPADLTAGATLTLRNESASEVHELVAMRLPAGETRGADELGTLPEGELNAVVGGPPVLVVIAPPEDDGFVALGDGTLADPGRYLLVCFIPTGADPSAFLEALEANPGEPPSVPGGPPHFTAGMYAEVTVR